MDDIHCVGQVDEAGLHAARDILGDGYCRSVRYASTKPSTNAWAMAELQHAGFDLESLPRLYLTDLQTAGRGRMGRAWISNESTLTFSLVASLTDELETSQLLPLAIGIGVARAIEFTFAPFRAAIKWPNDVYLGGAKVAGILVEATQLAATARVIGIGINVGGSPDLSDDSNAAPVTDIARSIGRPIHRYEFLGPVVVNVLEAINELADERPSIIKDFRDRCVLTGHELRLRSGDREQTGLCQGISEDGRLVVQTSEGVRRFCSGEASFIRGA